MEFGNFEQFNKNTEDTDVIEKEGEETLENTEEEIKKQDPMFGILTKKEVFETRKKLSSLINDVSEIRQGINNNKRDKHNLSKEQEILDKKEEIYKIIDNKKEQ